MMPSREPESAYELRNSGLNGSSDEPEFVFSAEGDDQREIRLALLTFMIPKKKS